MPNPTLKQRRIKLGLTQLEMGRLMEMHRQNIAKVERGARQAPPRYTKLLVALEAMSMSVRVKLIDAWTDPEIARVVPPH